LLLVPPPVVYAICFGLGLLCDWLVAWSPGWMGSAPARWGGGFCLAAAAILALCSAGLFWLRKTTVVPHGHPSRLVTGGPFSLSRNPIYVSLTAAYCGAALLTARAWPLVFLPGALAWMQLVVIPFEERRLREAFGDAYADYCRRVRRWL
jgi:protein-S-isoprenylcysteine O-methyltransferase Ste14